MTIERKLELEGEGVLMHSKWQRKKSQPGLGRCAYSLSVVYLAASGEQLQGLATRGAGGGKRQERRSGCDGGGDECDEVLFFFLTRELDFGMSRFGEHKPAICYVAYR